MSFRGLNETSNWLDDNYTLSHEEVKQDLNWWFHKDINLDYCKYDIMEALIFQSRINEGLKKKPYLGKGE